jgi:hypothetical protein
MDQISKDTSLDFLRSDPRWNKLLEHVKQNKGKKEAHLDKPLLRLLDSLVEQDQKWREYSRKYENGELGDDTISITSIRRNWKRVDSLNNREVRRIFQRYGYLNFDRVGEEGSNNFWLLVQHQDAYPQFQDSVLAEMKKEVDRKKASAINYAYLLDRVKVNTGQQQVYGTQMRINADFTSWEPNPLIEPEKVNERRKSVGLGTIEEYTAIMNSRFYGRLKKK